MPFSRLSRSGRAEAGARLAHEEIADDSREYEDENPDDQQCEEETESHALSLDGRGRDVAARELVLVRRPVPDEPAHRRPEREADALHGRAGRPNPGSPRD